MVRDAVKKSENFFLVEKGSKPIVIRADHTARSLAWSRVLGMLLAAADVEQNGMAVVLGTLDRVRKSRC